MKATRALRLLTLAAFAYVIANSRGGTIGTAFTYQGRLTEAGASYTGNAEFQATLWNAESDGAQVAANSPAQIIVGVSNGLFVLPLDFGSAAFSAGAERWLKLEVRTSIGVFTELTPRQKLTPAPVALTAINLPDTYSGAVTFSNPGNVFSGSGAGLTGLSAANIASGILPDARLGANVARLDSSPVFDGDIVGPRLKVGTDHRLLDIGSTIAGGMWNTNTGTASVICGGATNLVDGARYVVIGGGFGNRISSGSIGAGIGSGVRNRMNNLANACVIGGGADNLIAYLCTNSVIAGGWRNLIADFSPNCTIGGGDNNEIARNSDSATIGGGEICVIGTNCQDAAIGGGGFNKIFNNSAYGTIAGGLSNIIGKESDSATIGGGEYGEIGDNARYATVSGGRHHLIGTNSPSGTIGGGSYNSIDADSPHATVSGGTENEILSGGAYAAIPGGVYNAATNYAFAAGRRAKARHTGAFVWGDSNNADVASTNGNSVTMRASGGYRLFSNSGATSGVFLAPGSGTWSSMSDRNAKENFVAVDAGAVLEKVAALPLLTWNYRSQDASVRHIGPMAQDFKSAFEVGESATGISTVDADGVALAAIQGLNRKLMSDQVRLRSLEAENAELAGKLAELTALVNTLAAKLSGK